MTLGTLSFTTMVGPADPVSGAYVSGFLKFKNLRLGVAMAHDVMSKILKIDNDKSL